MRFAICQNSRLVSLTTQASSIAYANLSGRWHRCSMHLRMRPPRARNRLLRMKQRVRAAVTKPTEWWRQQTNLRVALPTLSTIEGGCEDSDEGFSLPARQLQRAQRNVGPTERRNEPQRPQQQRQQQQHVQQATRETGARPRTIVVRGTREQCPLHAGPVTREFFVFRVDKEHTVDDIKAFIQEQEVTVTDISCVCNADSCCSTL